MFSPLPKTDPFAWCRYDFSMGRMLSRASIDVQRIPDERWWKYDNVFERKWACNRDLPESVWDIYDRLRDPYFIRDLGELFEIDGLLFDRNLNGAGVHRIRPGGHLSIHLDYNRHPLTGWYRRLNLIVFLTPTWEREWGGDLEFWNADMTKCWQSFSPYLGDAVVFATSDHSYHGHPDPLKTPEGIDRLSLACYYYTVEPGPDQSRERHSTVYMPRPGLDAWGPDIIALRDQRAKGRLTA